MLNWFKKKDKNNIVPFPEIPKTQVKPPHRESEETKPAHTYYRLGLTDNNRVSLQMGYSEITMNAQGVQNLIDQLELYRNQIQVEGQE